LNWRLDERPENEWAENNRNGTHSAIAPSERRHAEKTASSSTPPHRSRTLLTRSFLKASK
jgi:hypothetical protein